MSLPEPVQPKKTDPTIWIIIAIAAVLVFCAGGIGLGAAIYFLRQPPKVKAIPLAPSSTRLPTKSFATLPPPAASGPLVVTPFDPSTISYPTLADLAPGWADSKTPGSKTYAFSVSRNTPVALYLGWCTTTAAILQENDQHISWSLVVDDQPVDMKGLFLWDNQESDRICRTNVGLIKQWTDSQHKIVTIMTVTQKINDGWDDYPAGDYSEIYDVTVTP